MTKRELCELGIDAGLNVVRSDVGKAVAGGGFGGCAAIGTGSVLSSAGAATGITALSGAGSAVTHAGCVMVNGAIATVGSSSVLGGVLATASTCVWAAAPPVAIAGASIWALSKLVEAWD